MTRRPAAWMVVKNDRLMAKAPADRYASARVFLDALTVAGQNGGIDPDATAIGDSDRTVLAASLRLNDPAPTGSGLGTGTGIATITPWKLEAIPALEAILSRQIGPMAKFLLKKASSKADSIDALCELLLPHIPSDVGQVQFQQAVALLKKKLAASGTGSGVESPRTGSGIVPGVAAGRSAIRVPVGFDDAWADAAAQRLTQFIGPIARVVAKRAARQTGDKAEFLQLLASHIESPTERARFLAEAGAAT